MNNIDIEIVDDRYPKKFSIKRLFSGRAVRISEWKLKRIQKKIARYDAKALDVVQRIEDVKKEMEYIEQDMKEATSEEKLQELREEMLAKEERIEKLRRKWQKYQLKIKSQKIKLPARAFDNITKHNTNDTENTNSTTYTFAAKRKPVQVTEDDFDELINQHGTDVPATELGSDNPVPVAEPIMETPVPTAETTMASPVYGRGNIDVPLSTEPPINPPEVKDPLQDLIEMASASGQNVIEAEPIINPSDNVSGTKPVEVEQAQVPPVASSLSEPNNQIAAEALTEQPVQRVKPGKKVIPVKARKSDGAPEIQNTKETVVSPSTMSISEIMKQAQAAKAREKELADQLRKEEEIVSSINDAITKQREINQKMAQSLQKVVEHVNSENLKCEQRLSALNSKKQAAEAEYAQVMDENQQLGEMFKQFSSAEASEKTQERHI